LTAENQEKPSLSRKQDAALAALVSQPTIALAASQAKVSERILYQWLAENEVFKAEYRRLRREIVNNAVFQIQKGTNNAVNCLISIMNDPEAPASSRVAAARTVLEMSFKGIEVDDLESRITAMEGRIEELGIKAHRNGRGSGHPTYR
jgi:hypothetical protein